MRLNGPQEDAVKQKKSYKNITKALEFFFVSSSVPNIFNCDERKVIEHSWQQRENRAGRNGTKIAKFAPRRKMKIS